MGCFLVLLMLLSLSTSANAFIEGIYCGRENCYDGKYLTSKFINLFMLLFACTVLELTRTASRQEIVKAYRRLAKKLHPDVYRGDDSKEDAAARFRAIASAYEVLKDEDSRKEYDYMLDNPEEVYHHYYAYYRRRYTPKVDIRIVIFVTISVISAFQYYGSQSRYKEAIDYFLTVPKYRIQAAEIAKSEGLLSANGIDKKKNRGRSKEEIREEEESILRQVIENKMDIKGGYSKPSIRDVLWIQLIILPYTIATCLLFYARWLIKFTILRQELGQEEKEYLVRRNMKLSQTQWDAVDEDEKDEYMELELWIASNFKTWKDEKDEEQKAKLAESASYKRYRRWMKKGGAGQITFMED